MKQINLVKFVESRRSKEGNVNIRVEASDGNTLQINFSPEVSEQILWSVLSTSGQAYANDWKLWPLAPDTLIRGVHSDGAMQLTFTQQNKVAFPVLLSPAFQQVLLQALTEKGQPKPHTPAH